MKSIFKSNKPGFTLVELLVVISIIAVLTAVSLVSLRGSRAVGRDTRRKAELEEIRSALEVFRSDPTTMSGGGGKYPQSFVESTYAPNALVELKTGGYIAEVPDDPLAPKYRYRYESSDGITYSLCAYLETKLPQAGNCTYDCGDVACNYKVTNP